MNLFKECEFANRVTLTKDITYRLGCDAMDEVLTGTLVQRDVVMKPVSMFMMTMLHSNQSLVRRDHDPTSPMTFHLQGNDIKRS
jgi:hypothetical protein